MLYVVTDYGLEIRHTNKARDTYQIGAFVGSGWQMFYGPFSDRERMGIALFGAFWRK